MVIIYIILLLVFVITAGVFCFVYFKYLKAPTIAQTHKVKDVVQESEEGTSETDSKSYLTYKSIDDYVLNLGAFQYRAIIECSSISYGLRSPEERAMIQYGFQAFLNSLTYPIVLYTQTRAVDNTKIMQQTRAKAEKTIEEFPEFENYTKNYLAHLEELPYLTGMPKCKKKYIIIPYECNTDLSELSDEEKEAFCTEELLNRVSAAINDMDGIGVKSRALNRIEIAQCIYSAFNRNEFYIVESIMKGMLSTISVQGTNLTTDLRPEDVLKSLLFETKNKIQARLEEPAKDNAEIMLYKKLYNVFDILVNEAGSSMSNMNELLELIERKGKELEQQNERGGNK